MPFLDLPVLQPLEAIRPPTTLLVRFGYLRQIGELIYDGPARPLCGARVVARTRRGLEIAEVLTTICSESGCAKAVSRDRVLAYIANSGGNDFPFSSEGKVLRVATADDLARQRELDTRKPEYTLACKTLISEIQLPIKLVDVEPLLGGEMVTFYFLSESRVDFRSLVKHLASRFHTRIQMHQVGARDEARLVADFETCGEHCCCRQFLKVLRPVSMGAAKMQKATLDPSKISGRCGRLKCCLRYEEDNYEELRRKLPRVGTFVRAKDGVGEVVETTILTQLVKVRLGEGRFIAVANEELLERDLPEPPRPAEPTDQNGFSRREAPRAEDSSRRQPRSRRESSPEDARPQPPRPPRRQDRRTEGPRVPGAPPASPKGDVENTRVAAVPPAPPKPAAGETPPAAPGVGMLGRRRRGRGRGRGPGEPPSRPDSAPPPAA
jgi:cell fate regulator YaaT (PSP1 superfamily)